MDAAAPICAACASNMLGNVLVCACCDTSFDTMIYKPMVLPCGHTVCYQCACNAVSERDEGCPARDCAAALPVESVEALAVNVLVLQLVQMARVAQAAAMQRREPAAEAAGRQEETVWCDRCAEPRDAGSSDVHGRPAAVAHDVDAADELESEEEGSKVEEGSELDGWAEEQAMLPRVGEASAAWGGQLPQWTTDYDCLLIHNGDECLAQSTFNGVDGEECFRQARTERMLAVGEQVEVKLDGGALGNGMQIGLLNDEGLKYLDLDLFNYMMSDGVSCACKDYYTKCCATFTVSYDGESTTLNGDGVTLQLEGAAYVAVTFWDAGDHAIISRKL
eukprot:PLAT12459.1.p1 GENE.PLAT12459.1~~PLAT12459.1.p1  ORF type:complete len:334 (+),score=76.89 PLAT12459.1:2-1003(+)